MRRFAMFAFCSIIFGCVASQAHAQGRFRQSQCGPQGCSTGGCGIGVVSFHTPNSQAITGMPVAVVQPSPQPTCAVQACGSGSCQQGQTHERRRLFHRRCR